MEEPYPDDLRKFIIDILEKDIQRFSHQFHISGFDSDDIAQELRLTVWTYSYNYDSGKSSIRTWGNRLLRGKLHKLFRDNHNTDKRKVNSLIVEYDDSRDNEYDD